MKTKSTTLPHAQQSILNTVNSSATVHPPPMSGAESTLAATGVPTDDVAPESFVGAEGARSVSDGHLADPDGHATITDPVHPLSPEHETLLRQRAVDPGFAAYAGLRSVSADEGSRLLGYQVQGGGLLIPYANQLDYFRLRLDEGETRFLVPKGRPVPIYIPPDFSGDIGSTLFIVEGPIKALALQDQGFDTVGLGGVATTLRSTSNGTLLDSSWDAVRVTGRVICIVFDGGRATNAEVAIAEARLARALTAKRARVLVAAVPLRDDGGDQGPDDFLAAHGRVALASVIAQATPAGPVEHAAALMALPAIEQPKRAAQLLGDLPFLLAVYSADESVKVEVARLLKPAGVKEPVLRRAVAEAAAKLDRVRATLQEDEQPRGRKYVEIDGKFCFAQSREPFCNFTARIEKEVRIDDAVAESREWVVSITLPTGERLPAKPIEVSVLSRELWVLETFGWNANLYSVQGAAGHLRSAMQEHSRPVIAHRYTHTGWREDESGRWSFLHAGGAIGADDVSVDLGTALARYRLPSVPEDARAAVELSLSFLDLADDRITMPLFSAVYRAPLQHALACDASIALYGPSGSMKSTLAAVAAAHFGDFDAEHLPANWSSTVNSLEATAFSAKDVLLPIDDFAPACAGAIDDLQKKASTFFRSVGNANSRGRLDKSLRARPDRVPRALVVATCEDLPISESIQARLFSVRMDRGAVDIRKLSQLQAHRSRLPHAMTQYILWLAGQMPHMKQRLQSRFIELRDGLQSEGQHLRGPGAIANLLLGVEMFGMFAVDLGVLDLAGAERLNERARNALLLNAVEQQRTRGDLNPARRFIEILHSLLVQQHVTLSSLGFWQPGDCPNNVGWRDLNFVYLDPEASYRAVVEAMRRAGETMPLTPRALWRRLVGDGIAIPDGDHSLTKVSAGGARPRLVKIPGHVFYSAITDLVSERLADELNVASKAAEAAKPPDDAIACPGCPADGFAPGQADGETESLSFSAVNSLLDPSPESNCPTAPPKSSAIVEDRRCTGAGPESQRAAALRESSTLAIGAVGQARLGRTSAASGLVKAATNAAEIGKHAEGRTGGRARQAAGAPAKKAGQS